jgi:hypothetical protein
MTRDRRDAAIGCSLTAAGLGERSSRWEDLLARALIDKSATGDGVRLRFRADPGVQEELCKLVRLERECCGFADWTMSREEGNVILDVAADGIGTTVVRSMFDGAL